MEDKKMEQIYTILEEVETWDSVAVLSFIAFMNEKFDKIFHASELTLC